MHKKILIALLFMPSALFSFAQNVPGKDKDSKEVILFICEHGAARSTIAAAFFNKLAKEQNLNYTAVFRGTDPDTVLTTGTAKGLVNDGFDISGWMPEQVTDRDIKNAYRIITFDCRVPLTDSVSVPVEKWDGIPPISKDYNIARNQIAEKVNRLIGELPRAKKKKYRKKGKLQP